MIIFQLFLATSVTKICYSTFTPDFQAFNPVSVRVEQQQYMIPHLKNHTALEGTKDNIKFLLPFLDMEIRCYRSLHVLQEVEKKQIYILHGHELYQLFIDRQERRVILVGELEGNVRHEEPLASKIIYWRRNFLLIIALEEHLQVYELAEDILIQRANTLKDPTSALGPPPIFDTIQQLTLNGRFQNLFLFSPGEERIAIVAVVNFTTLYGKLRIFEWFHTYFDPIEDITVPSIHVVNVIGSQTKYLVAGQKIQDQARTVLTVYEISPSVPKFLIRQTLTVESHIVHIFTYLDRNVIVGCSTQQSKCSVFRQMPDGYFSIYKHLTSEQLPFDLMTGSTSFIAATRQNQVMVFSDHRLDCYAGFILDQADVTDLIGYQNANNENYVLLVYKRPFNALLRIVELEINDRKLSSRKFSAAEETGNSHPQNNLFQFTIEQLRSELLKRKMDMDIFRQASQVLSLKPKNLKLKQRITLHSGNVDVVKVIGKHLRSPKQIMQRIENLRRKYLSQRPRRFNNHQLIDGSLDLKNRTKFRRMRIENLIYAGDVMEGFSINQINLKERILNIKPKAATRNLNTTELLLSNNLRQTRLLLTPDILDLRTSIRFCHLKVDFINGVSWNEFYDSLFLKNRDKSVEGTLVFQSEVKVKHLMATNLNGLVVSNLFNLIQPQVIYADLEIEQFFVHDINARTVNGLVFEDDIVFSGTDPFIESPVKMHYLYISDNLLLSNNTNKDVLSANPAEVELHQYYTNKIILNGSLNVYNLNRLNKKTKIVLGDMEFSEEIIEEKYMLRQQPQNFTFPVTLDYCNVTASNLKSNYLNNHPTEKYMLVNKAETDTPLQLMFMNAHGQQDVTCRNSKSILKDIKENVIHAGDIVHISGSKLFMASLEVDHMQVLRLNQVAVKDLIFKTNLNKSKQLQFKDTKTFSTITVKNPACVEQYLLFSYLNNLLWDDVLKNDYYMDQMHVTHLVQITNLIFAKINGISFEGFFTKLHFKNDRLMLHKCVKIEGNANFTGDLQLHYINNIAWNAYVDNLVHNNQSVIVQGQVIFQHDLTVTKKFEAPEINGYDLEIIFRNILLKSKPQLITGMYKFDNIRALNMDVLQINEVNVSEFLDIKRSLHEAEGNITVEDLNIGKNLQSFENDFSFLLDIERHIKQMPLKLWKNLYILRNASWPAQVKDNQQQYQLKYLYKSAVKYNGDQIITGNIKMSGPLITNMRTRFKFPPHVDIDFIRKDALLKHHVATQIIKGHKFFLKPLQMEALKVKYNLNTNFLNKIDVARFNQSLYRISSQVPLKGPMTFVMPLTVNHLLVPGLINGATTNLIYQLRNNSYLPDLVLHELYATNNLFIRNINNLSLQYLLHNRLNLQGLALEHFGTLTFENLVIEKKGLIQSINGIAITDLVFKHSSRLQTITGNKTVERTLELVGPVHVMYINNKILKDLYHSSLKKDEDYEFDSLVLQQATFEKDMQFQKSSNNTLLQERSFGEHIGNAATAKQEFLAFLREYEENLNNSHTNILHLDGVSTMNIKLLDSSKLEVDQIIHEELSRISPCKKEYMHISFQYPNNVYWKNITRNSLIKILPEISIKADNFCRFRKDNVKSKITISGQKAIKVFGLKRYIENIYTLELVSSSEYLVILHALDLPSLNRNEVRIFKVCNRNQSVLEWQSLIQNIGENVKLYKLTHLNILITNGPVDHQPAVSIYHFNNNSQLFQLDQIIYGIYNIMEMVDLPNNMATKQLILSCFNCYRIFIYELNHSELEYKIVQIITLKLSFDKLLIFNLNNEHYMLLVSRRSSNFYNIYKYAYIQGWIYVISGYFPNFNTVIPITQLWNRDSSLMVAKKFNGLPLILLCNTDTCYLVKAII